MADDITTLGENIHNAFLVVFETLKSIEKLIAKCQTDYDDEKYYMPAKKFMHYSSEKNWQGWIYWSFILLYQRREDGRILKNGWIDAPLYAVEINVDAETCDTPRLIVAQMRFSGIPKWLSGYKTSDHSLVYSAIHGDGPYEVFPETEEIDLIKPQRDSEEKVAREFWGFQSLRRMSHELVDLTQDNYREILFGMIEELAEKDN